MILNEESYLEWYGRGHLDGGHSGRYPWGSGKDPYQSLSPLEFYSQYHTLKSLKMTDKQIAEEIGISQTSLKYAKTIANSEQYNYLRSKAIRLSEKGWSNVAIGKEIGKGESYVRNLLKDSEERKLKKTEAGTDVLLDALKDGQILDVGSGVEHYLNMTPNQLKACIAMAKSKGAKIYYAQVTQAGTGKKTTIKALVPEEMTYQEFMKRKNELVIPNVQTLDGGLTYQKIKPPVNVDLSRIKVIFKEEGGADKDGLIELRPGVEDLSLGGASYAQVRIKAGGTHYLKGMAVVNPNADFPPGVDIIFNSNKSMSKGVLGSLKKLKNDEENPFGAYIKQQKELVLCQNYYKGKDGKMHQSALNIVNEEGDWSRWSRNLSSQFLSKQSVSLAREQLGKNVKKYKKEMSELYSLTNPAVKQKLLLDYAESLDGAAVHMKAAAMPRQATHVIVPIPSLKKNEIYAPNYIDGETVALVRFPFGGNFEIAECKVNNKNAEGRSILGLSPRDAVGINAQVANRLSGADFDGDSVLVIPNNSGKVKSAKPLPGLVNFDTKQYQGEAKTSKDKTFRYYDKDDDTGYYSYKLMPAKSKGSYMGDITNLITDMHTQNATNDEIERAVKHSMVVIDSPKHKLDFTQSYKDNRIAELKEKYQGGKRKGASTIISQSTSEAHPKDRRVSIDPDTGKKVYTYTGKTNKFYDKETGTTVYKDVLTTSTKMAETDDATTLVRNKNNKMEMTYANYANTLKDMANQCRKEAVNISLPKKNSDMAEKYSAEVESLKVKLNQAEKNAPLERKAQILASEYKDMYRKANPEASGEDIKKQGARALTRARNSIGASKQKITPTEKEWEAIQNNAISPTLLKKILDNADTEVVREFATPRSKNDVSDYQKQRARAMRDNGYTPSEIADTLGISVDNIHLYL